MIAQQQCHSLRDVQQVAIQVEIHSHLFTVRDRESVHLLHNEVVAISPKLSQKRFDIYISK